MTTDLALFSEAMRRHQAGQIAEAEAAYRQILAQSPQYPEAMQMLGVLLSQSARVDEGEGLIRQAIAINPSAPNYHSNLGFILSGLGRTGEAIECYRRAISLSPQTPEFHNNLGSALLAIRRWDEALLSLRHALALRPQYPEAHFNTGNVLHQLRRWEQAIEAYRHAVAQRPGYAEAWHNLGNALRDTHRFDEAIQCYQKAQSLGFDGFELHSNLATTFKDLGDLDESIRSFQRALALKSDAVVASNLLCTLHFHPQATPQSLHDAHQQWNNIFAKALSAEIHPHDNDSNPGRRLRIGYVSPYFRDHCQALFLVPLLSNHDRQDFEIFCYSDVVAPDAITDRLKNSTAAWRNIVGMSDEQAAELVRRDKMDILVDLSVHMADHRLLMFARKPAPVQVTWLGYPGTTGLETMDYRLSDAFLDPIGHDRYYSEQTLRLPDSFWCYDPLTNQPHVNELPAIGNRHVTFGCLNNFCKVTESTLRLWSQVLMAVPDSRLLVLAPQGEARHRLSERLGRQGVSPTRIEFASHVPRSDYLKHYHRIDIGLDTFPYNGHTTTLDSLWMGVPVVSVTGETAVSRGGLSILTNVGLSELVANDIESYVRIAGILAWNVPRLAAMRRGLREQMRQSSLMDAPRFARKVEGAFRAMWHNWCNSRGKSSRIR